MQGLLATEPLAHQVGDAAAVALHDVEQLVPEGAGAEAGHDGQVEADIDDGAAGRTAADLGLELLQRGGVEIGGSVVVVREVPQRAQCGRAGDGGSGRRVWVGWCGVDGVRTGAMAGKCDVAAAGGAGEEDAFECRGAQDAAMQVGEDEREIDGAEAGGERDEAGSCGAVADAVGEVAAVGEQGANDREERGEAWGVVGGRSGWESGGVGELGVGTGSRSTTVKITETRWMATGISGASDLAEVRGRRFLRALECAVAHCRSHGRCGGDDGALRDGSWR